jgi:RES domain-containing protein
MMTEQQVYGVFDPMFGYRHFDIEIRRRWRYVFPQNVQKYLSIIRKTAEHRKLTYPQYSLFFRAQRGCEMQEVMPHPSAAQLHEIMNERLEQSRPKAYDTKRMTPRLNRSPEGRVNPKGIPCLYLAEDVATAINEVRPWGESFVTVAQFVTKKELTLVDCTVGVRPSAGKIAVNDSLEWTIIDHAFSLPVTTSDDRAEYAATQILAEVFRQQGYHGIVYKSSFTNKNNVALFSLDDAGCLQPSLYRVKEYNWTVEPVQYATV